MSEPSDRPEPDSSHIEPTEQYLYRGTTRGWPGNPVLREEEITCTTTDPLVATLFAIECRNHGQAVVLIASREPFRRLRVRRNWFMIYEAAVNVQVSPEEFERRATFSVEVDRAIMMLKELGFPELPQRLAEKSALRDALVETHRDGLRLGVEQILAFNRLVKEEDS